MPKLSKDPTSISVKMDYHLSQGPYDGAYIYHGSYKIGQLTLIRCEQTRELLQLFKSAGIPVTVEPDIHAKKVSGSVPQRSTKKPIKKSVKQ